MTISFSGLVSGLDTSSWVESLVALKQAKVTTLETQKTQISTQQQALSGVKSYFSSLQSLVQKVTDTKFGISSMDLFGQNVANVSDTSVLTASIASSAEEGTYAVTVNNIATNTTMHSNSLGVASESSTLGDLGVTEGTLSLYRDGEKFRLNVKSDWTIADLENEIQTKFADVNVEWNNGKLQMFSTDNVSLIAGSNVDTSNFTSIFNLQSKDDDFGTTYTIDGESYSSGKYLESSRTMSAVTGNTKITSLGVSEGDFILGNATLTIDEDTTFNSLIKDINASEEANATAYLDTANGQLVIKSKTAGASLINVEAVTSDFTDVMGFTNGSFEKNCYFWANFYY